MPLDRIQISRYFTFAALFKYRIGILYQIIQKITDCTLYLTVGQFSYFQELLFCETCDTVFCTLCTGGTHKPGSATATSPTHSGGTDSGNNSPAHNASTSTADHTVIPFSIAIKRMSEILIYKANECTARLDEATEIVNNEIHR